MTKEEARELLGVSAAWLYKLIAAGRIRVVEGGRRGQGKATTLVRDDVLREKERRAELLGRRLRGMKND